MDRAVTEQKIQEVVDKIVKEYQPEKIILFGSWAWGDPGPDSDVDLFVIKNTERSTRDVAREIDGTLFPRPFPIDLIVYTPEELQTSIHNNHNLFIEDIIRNGKVLYAKPGSQINIMLPQRELSIA